MRRGGRRRRSITTADAAVTCSGRWGRRRTRVTECWAVLRAEDLYTSLLSGSEPVAAGGHGEATWTVGERSFEVAFEVRANRVWRYGRVFLQCSRCSRRATRIYVPTAASWAACRRCWGLTYQSRTQNNYKDRGGGILAFLGASHRSMAYIQTEHARERRREASIERWADAGPGAHRSEGPDATREASGRVGERGGTLAHASGQRSDGAGWGGTQAGDGRASINGGGEELADTHVGRPVWALRGMPKNGHASRGVDTSDSHKQVADAPSGGRRERGEPSKRDGQPDGCDAALADAGHGQLQEPRRRSEGRAGPRAAVPLFPPGPRDTDAWAAILAERPELAPAQSAVCGVAPRVAAALEHRAHRLRLLGNGVVPLVAAVAFRLLCDRLEPQ